jgi:hypothetical protein
MGLLQVSITELLSQHAGHGAMMIFVIGLLTSCATPCLSGFWSGCLYVSCNQADTRRKHER